MIYYILFALLTIESVTSVLSGKYKNNNIRVTYLSTCCILFVFCAFRGMVGYDCNGYREVFKLIDVINADILKTSELVDYELLYVALCKISPNYETLQVLTAVISMIPLFYIMYKYSEIPFLTLLMYYCGLMFTYHMGVVRQGIAITLILVAIVCLAHDKKMCFIILSVIAFMFHTTSFIVVPLYFIYDKMFTRKQYYILLIITILYSIVGDSETIINLASKIPIEAIQHKTEAYGNNLIEGQSLFMSVIKRAIFFVVFYEAYRFYKIDNKMDYVFLNTYYLSIILMSFMSSIPIVAGRGTAALYMTQMFVFSAVVSRIKDYRFRLCFFLLIEMMFFKTMYAVITDPTAAFDVYENFLFV